MKYVQNLNTLLNKNACGNLKFDDNSIMQPHITLFIGTINTRDFDEVCNILQEEFKNLRATTLEFLNFEISKNNHWAFLYIKPNSVLDDFIKNLHIKLCNYVEFEKQFPLHITLSHADNLQDKLPLLNSQKLPDSLDATQFALGICGQFGSVLKPLRNFTLA